MTSTREIIEAKLRAHFSTPGCEVRPLTTGQQAWAEEIIAALQSARAEDVATVRKFILTADGSRRMSEVKAALEALDRLGAK
jgi:DNA-binding transcriptional regulator LsrR (DeoR family)